MTDYLSGSPNARNVEADRALQNTPAVFRVAVPRLEPSYWRVFHIRVIS